MHRLLLVGILFFFGPIWVTHAQSPSTSIAYVSLDGENRIAGFELSREGELTKKFDVETESPPGGLCMSPDKKYLYASLRRAGKLASFEVGADTGELRHLTTVDAGDDPAFVTTDKSGQYLLVAYYVAAKVTVHRLNDGKIQTPPLQIISTQDKAHAILTDCENRFVFVPHTGPNAIYQFLFDSTKGQLTANKPAFLATGESTGPRQFAFHPKLDVVYFDYEQGSAIAAFDLNRESGQLKYRQRLSTLPQKYVGENTNARIEMASNGKFIYVANRGHDSLAGYAIDQNTGDLSRIGIFPTEATPRGFAIDGESKYLLAAGQASDKLAMFAIDRESGKLKRIGTYDVGKRPWWVLIAK